jgi:hypothetical protein
LTTVNYKISPITAYNFTTHSGLVWLKQLNMS